eukprot:754354-Prymnesium_polylepis.1
MGGRARLAQGRCEMTRAQRTPMQRAAHRGWPVHAPPSPWPPPSPRRACPRLLCSRLDPQAP